MVTSGLATATSWVGPSSFLRVSVARMAVILALRRPPPIGHSEPRQPPDPLVRGRAPLRLDRACDPQRLGARRGGLQPVHAAPADPHQRRSGQQRMVLPDLPGGGLVEVGVLARDERAAAPADPDAL